MKLWKANGRYYASDSICSVSNIRVTKETYVFLFPWKICRYFNIENEKIIGEKTCDLFFPSHRTNTECSANDNVNFFAVNKK